MTLILTEITTDGIAMASDSLWTYPSGSTDPSPKLFKIPDLNAGISTWGGTPDGADAPDDWIQEFFRNHRDSYGSIEGFANELKKQAIDDFEKIKVVPGSFTDQRRAGLGFHIAGYESGKPYFFNLNNNPSQGEPKMRDKTSACVYLEDWREEARKKPQPGRGWLINNGDWEGFRLFFDKFDEFRQIIANQVSNFSLPGNGNVYSHAKFLGLLILFTGGVYQLSNLTDDVDPSHIGGEPHVMAMDTKKIAERKTLKITGDGLVLD